MSQTSVIHDLGYQRYNGARLGRSYAVRSLYVRSLRSAFGMGHGLKAKIFPWSVIGIIGLVAIIIAAISSTSGEDLVTYAQFCDSVSTLTVLLAASVASEIISKDIGVGVLPLYFARPLTRSDYGIAKLVAVVSALALVLWTSQLVMFAGAAFSNSDGGAALVAETGQLAGGLAYSLINALVIGSIAALAASLCKRRIFAAVAVVIVFLVTSPIAAIISVLGSGAVAGLSGLISPLQTLMSLQEWLFDGAREAGSYGPAYCAGAMAMVVCASMGLILRYRTVKA